MITPQQAEASKLDEEVIECNTKNTGSNDLSVQKCQIEQHAEHWSECDNLQQVQSDVSFNGIDPIKNMTEEYGRGITEQRVHWPELVQQVGNDQLQVYEKVRHSGTYNLFGLKQPIPSLLKYEAWVQASTGHSDDEWLLPLIRYGFPLQYVGPPDPSRGKISPNHKSALQHDAHIASFIVNEVHNHTIIGPFQKLPFKWANVAPMMTRPKSNPLKRRVIVDYSYPEGGINASIYKNVVFGTEVNHTLPTVAQAIDIIKANHFKVSLASVDLERAYRNFRTDPSDWPLTCIQHQKQYYVDTALPFGSRISSLYMQRIADFIQRALAVKGIQILVYLDDGLIITTEEHDPHTQLWEVIQTIRALGLPLAYDKIQEPAHRCRFLGIIIDVKARQVEIPREKIDSFLSLLMEVSGKKFISKTTLQSMVGSVNHLAKAVQGARLFMNRFLDCLRGVTGNRVEVSTEMLADIEWFLHFLKRYNGKTLVNDGQPRLFLEVDSCLVGGGGTDGTRAYMYQYPPAMTQAFNISQLEAINCLIAVRALVDSTCHDKLVSIACDNLGAVSVFQNSRGRDRVLNAVARALWYFGAANNVEFRFIHKPGTEMFVPDVLSRAYVDSRSYQWAEKVIAQRGLNIVKISPRMHDFNNYH